MTTSPLTPDRPTFRALVADVAAKAKAVLPQTVNGRIESAVKLVLAGDVFFCEDGTVEVGSSDPTRYYKLVGTTCTCTDFTSGKAPDGWCKHRTAAGIQKRVQALLPQASPVETTTAPQAVHEAPVAMPHGLDPRHIVHIQGKPFVKFAGLLELAHQRGLQSLTVEWTFNDPTVSLAHAVAVFPFGTFAESADSTPDNVGKKVALHWRRLSLTRAKARALRDALNCDMVALEELGDQ